MGKGQIAAMPSLEMMACIRRQHIPFWAFGK